MINESAFKLKKNGEPTKHCVCRHPEKIENYDKAISDALQTWETHHRKEDTFSQKELKECGEYYDVQPEDLIFLTKAEHHKMDSKCKRVSEAIKGKKHSEEAKRKMSETRKGRKPTWRMKKVLCIETGETFESTRDASRKTGIGNISQVCNGKYKTAGGYHWRFV